MEWAKHILTGRDNETHDIARHSWVWSLVATVGIAIVNAMHAGVVDLMAFGTAVAAIVGAHGAAIGFKKSTEPDPKEGAK